ncbi:MAG: hypothetical protein R3300_07760 [Candidatus Promineifilaceae bacterium]|nr:hypothetical protein [Candidatus Promineifilaceae bacterium]
MTDLLGFVLAVAYVFSIIGLAELTRRWRGYGGEYTRKIVHIGVGMLAWIVPFLFSSPWPFVLAALTFAVINLLDWRFGFFPAMVSADRTNLGTVYFPLAAATVALLFWRQPPLMVAALMPLTWGDGLASVVGRAYGTHRYAVFGQQRSLQGSAAFFVMGGIFTWLALWLLPGPPEIGPAAALLPALAIVVATTITEAFSVYGLDNLTVTAAAVLVLSVWPF